jgi:hypothetical protein
MQAYTAHKPGGCFKPPGWQECKHDATPSKVFREERRQTREDASNLQVTISASQGCTKQGTNLRNNSHGRMLRTSMGKASSPRGRMLQTSTGRGQARQGRALQTFTSPAGRMLQTSTGKARPDMEGSFKPSCHMQCMHWLHKHNGPKPMGGRFKPPWMWPRIPFGRVLQTSIGNPSLA